MLNKLTLKMVRIIVEGKVRYQGQWCGDTEPTHFISDKKTAKRHMHKWTGRRAAREHKLWIAQMATWL